MQLVVCFCCLFLLIIDVCLIVIDVDIGKLCESFGDCGIVDFSVGMGEVKVGYYQQIFILLVVGNVVVVGGCVVDNYFIGELLGVVCVFDVYIGKLVWVWDLGNLVLIGVLLEGQIYMCGMLNVWLVMFYDVKLNLIYLFIGNVMLDFFGGECIVLDDKYSFFIVVVDVIIGQVCWYFQIIYYDLWDFDLLFQLLLYDLFDGKGGIILVLVQISKQGMIFMFNCEIGELVVKVEECLVLVGNVKGECYLLM